MIGLLLQCSCFPLIPPYHPPTPNGALAGNRLWPSAATLAEFLLTLPAAAPSPTLTCIELGAGLGAVGMLLAARGGAKVLLTDQPQMLPLLRRNVDECFGPAAGSRRRRRGSRGDHGNASVAPTSGPWARSTSRTRSTGGSRIWAPELCALTWGGGLCGNRGPEGSCDTLGSCDDGDDDDDDNDDDDGGGGGAFDGGGGSLPARYPLVIGSDLCYDEGAFAGLRATIDAVAGPGATVVLAVHDRPAAHAFFLAPSTRWSWQLSACVDQGFDPVSGKSRIMVYVGREANAAAAATAAAAAAGGGGGGGRGGAAAEDSDGAESFALGEVVEVHSLASARALNGQRGVVVQTRVALTGGDSPEPAGRRFGVSFAPPLGRKAVKASNLRRVVTGQVRDGTSASAANSQGP